jgi:hypothetical protein
MAKEEVEISDSERELLELYDFWIEEWEDGKFYTDIKGRPLKMTPKIVANLLSAFSNSFTDDEACIYTDISKNTLYRFVEKNPHFWNQKEILKQKPNIKAKLNKIKAINEWNTQESWWWLERKSKNEFSLKTEVEQNTNMDLKIEAKAIDSLNTLLWSD